MAGELEAAGDVLTGAVVGAVVEGEPPASGPQEHAEAQIAAHGACRNCGATLTGPFCATCGQRAHIHRSLLAIGHDILHGVFHFEGKIWRTAPELFFHPGRLTRRYIDGERARFVSPMALFLFTVFLMFAVFSLTGALSGSEGLDSLTGNWRTGNASALQATEEKIENLQEERSAEGLSPEQRARLDSEIAELESSRVVMEALANGDWKRIAELDEQQQQAAPSGESAEGQAADAAEPTFERRLNEGLRQLNSNPGLLIYKLKTNGYKFSWALIPLSLPFMWLLFFWRRDIRLYDHAVFVTYSISFMMLLTILVSLAAAAGVSGWIWGTALSVVPPLHMYRQLRGAYGLSRFGANVRLFLLLISIILIAVAFMLLLLLIGVFG